MQNIPQPDLYYHQLYYILFNGYHLSNILNNFLFLLKLYIFIHKIIYFIR